MAEAIRFRNSFGLRADDAWIIEVALDPRSWRGSMRYGTPLTPEEVSELDSRQARLEGAAPAIEAYGQAVASEWGGLFLDHRAGGVVVAQFTGEPAIHVARLRELIPGDNRLVEVRQVRWSLIELERYRLRIEADIDRIARADLDVTGLGIDVQRNIVELDISSARPEAEADVLAHFGRPEWLAVTSDGIGRWNGPRGSLLVRAAGAGGVPVPGVWCVFLADDPAAAVDSTSSTDERGECRLDDLGATSFTIELRARTSDDMLWLTVGRGRARVLADRVSVVAVPVDAVPPRPDAPAIEETTPGNEHARFW